MPYFTVETTYRVPHYRQHSYEAETIEEACKMALEDQDWADQETDYDNSGSVYVTGVWPGKDTAYDVENAPIPDGLSCICAR